MKYSWDDQVPGDTNSTCNLSSISDDPEARPLQQVPSFCLRNFALLFCFTSFPDGCTVNQRQISKMLP